MMNEEQMNGMGDASFDDVNKYTRVGVNIEIRQLQSDRLLITEGNKQHLATAEEHISGSQLLGTLAEHHLIAQAHRLMLTYRTGDRARLLQLVRELCPQTESPLWRLLAFLKEHLPESKDLKDVQGLLIGAEQLRQECQRELVETQQTMQFED